MKKTAPLLIALILFFASSIWAAGPQEPAPELQTFVDRALDANPELKTAEERWRIFVEQSRQAGSLDDPMLMLGINNGVVQDPLDFDRDNMTSKLVGISQSVPYFGKRALAREAAEKEALNARAQQRERELELTEMVKETYFRLYFIDQALEIVGRNLRVMDDLIQFTEARYGVGEAIQQDVLQAQVERSQMLEMQIGLQQQRRSLEAVMNRLLFRPGDATVGRIAALEVPPVDFSQEALVQMAFESRPALEGLLAQVEKGEVEEKLARKAFYPDFTFSLEYMQRDRNEMGGEGLDMYSAGISFNLPVQRQRRHAQVAEAQASQRMAHAEVEALKNTIATGIADQLGQLERSQKLIRLYEGGIIPQATRSFEAARIAYQNNQLDFPAVMESLVRLFNYEREYYSARAGYRMSLAELEALVGRELLQADAL